MDDIDTASPVPAPLEEPQAGGSYIRDPLTGVLTRIAGPAPAAPADNPSQIAPPAS